MSACLSDSAHDKEHVYRVLCSALAIAESEKNVDRDILIAACLLHDISRPEQQRDPAVCHALRGGDRACAFLREQGFSEEFAQAVRHCIQTHRFRNDLQPQTIEAKILFDADKLDATGAIGTARTLLYQGNHNWPLYTREEDGSLNTYHSYLREYTFKLSKLYDTFYTAAGWEMAQKRQPAAQEFYNALLQEVEEGYREGSSLLEKALSDN